MELIIIFSLIYFIICIFFSLGYFVNYKFQVIEKNSYFDLIIFGYSILTLLSFHSYFILKLRNEYLLLFLLLFFTYFCLKFRKFFNLNNIIKYFLIIFIFIFIFCIPLILYGEQFYVFRGNYWDNFNYLSSAILFNKFSYSDVNNQNILANFKNFQSIDLIILYRPFINYFLSLFLYLKSIDIFLLNFTFKVFLSLINFFAFISFLDIFKKIKKNKKIILSFILSFSFFSLYIFEIEALSHLGSISIFLISLKYLSLFINQNIQNGKSSLLFLIILISSLFIIYPEIFIFFVIISLGYILSKLNVTNYKIYLQNFLFCSLIFLLLTISSYEINYKYLIMQFSQATNSNVDWWTYYGAFIFGRENLVLDNDYILLIQENLVKNNILDLIKMFFLDHFERGYKLILINIIPSFFGLYFLTEGKIDSNFSYLILLATILINIYLILIVVKNLHHIIYKKLNHIIFPSILVFLLIIIFLLNGNFWTIIKIYSYALIFIFLIISVNFNTEKINKFIILLLLTFPFYKYSTFNYGIGVFDSFPSIINKKYKTNINWNLDRKKLANCEKIYTSEKDYFVKSYINMKSIYADKPFENSKDFNKKKIFCEISVINKNFVVAKY